MLSAALDGRACLLTACRPQVLLPQEQAFASFSPTPLAAAVSAPRPNCSFYSINLVGHIPSPRARVVTVFQYPLLRRMGSRRVLHFVALERPPLARVFLISHKASSSWGGGLPSNPRALACLMPRDSELAFLLRSLIKRSPPPCGCVCGLWIKVCVFITGEVWMESTSRWSRHVTAGREPITIRKIEEIFPQSCSRESPFPQSCSRES